MFSLVYFIRFELSALSVGIVVVALIVCAMHVCCFCCMLHSLTLWFVHFVLSFLSLFVTAAAAYSFELIYCKTVTSLCFGLLWVKHTLSSSLLRVKKRFFSFHIRIVFVLFRLCRWRFEFISIFRCSDVDNRLSYTLFSAWTRRKWQLREKAEV